MPSPSLKTENGFDVCIVGAGIAGTLLGAILARHGVRVLIVEENSHPRFAIGESTVPETTGLLRIIGQRYGVPEIGYLSTFHNVQHHISSACGVKRNFSFVYHRDHEEPRPTETTQMPTWAPPFGPDMHIFRQDIDAYMLTVAIRYGATVRQQTSLTKLEIGPTGVALETNRGQHYTAKYLIDASGYRSLLASTLDLREQPCSLRTHSRSLFTHMVGVKPYDECGPPRQAHGLPSPFCQGTLHHIFAGGWFWVIPFNNHPAATNPLCSVGLNLDLERYPRTELPPEQEFQAFVSRFPSLARQFENAQPVREWVATDRVQYSSKQIVGERFCLMPHAAGFIDPLFSSGLSLTVSTINVLAHRIISAVAENDFSVERFLYVEEWFKHNLAHFDRLVSCSYMAFSDFELWNAWHRLWMIGSLFGISGLYDVYGRSFESASTATYEEYPYRGLQAVDLKEYAELFDQAASEVEAVHQQGRAPAEAAQRIYALIKETQLSPAPWHLDNPQQRFPMTFTLIPMLRLLLWGRFKSSPAIIRFYFTGGRLRGFLGLVGACLAIQFQRSATALWGLARDHLFSWNTEWASHTGTPPRGE